MTKKTFIKLYNEFSAEEKSGLATFAIQGLEFQDEMLTNLDLCSSVIVSTIFKDIQFHKINFESTSFYSCTFENCSFIHCNFFEADFSDSKFLNSQFISSMLNYVSVFGSNFINSAFLESQPRLVFFFDCNFKMSSQEFDSQLSKSSFKNCKIWQDEEFVEIEDS